MNPASPGRTLLYKVALVVFALSLLFLALIFWLMPGVSRDHASQPRGLAASTELAPAGYPVPTQPLRPPPMHLQAVLKQLQASDKTRPVRVLFYGQSITEQGWWQIVVKYLQETYPNAALQVENRAIGGHSALLLVKTAEADLYPFQPDLVIFHVYGDPNAYRKIVRSMQEQTTASILLATDHIVADDELDEETNSLKLRLRTLLFKLPGLVSQHDRDANWNAWMNYSFLPAVADQYAAELADVRAEWKVYLRDNKLAAKQLLRDDIHLNDHGKYLMAEIVKSYLAPQNLVTGSNPDDRVTEVAVPGAQTSAAKPFRLVFNGSRVDAVLRDSDKAGSAVHIDGKLPCSWPQLYAFQRTSTYPGSNWPALLRIQRGPAMPTAETWRLALQQADSELKQFGFKLTGSITGPDGSGTSTERFVSKSGEIIIEPGDWDLAYGRQVLKTELPEGFEVTWPSKCLGIDALPSSGNVTSPLTIAQGLPNTQHVLTIDAGGADHITALRIYRPRGARE